MQNLFLGNPQHLIPRLLGQQAWNISTAQADLLGSLFILANWKGSVL